MLRSAQTIVAGIERPPSPIPAGDAAFSALLGWWYAEDAREFITDDPTLRGIALALAAAADQMRSRRMLTPGMLDDAMRTGGLAMTALPDVLDAVLRDAEEAHWPPLLLAAELASGSCGRVRSIPASIARAIAPLAGHFTSDVFVVPAVAEEVSGALHLLADESRAVLRRVATYRDACATAAARCREFGRGGASAAALVRLLSEQPALTVAAAASALGLTVPTAGAAIERLLGAGLLSEITGRGRDRVFVYTPAVAIAG